MITEKYTIKHIQFWQIILSLGAASLFIFATMYFMQPLLPLLTESFQISVSYASLAMSMTTIGLIFGLLAIGFMSDRRGRTKFIHLSIICSTILLFIIPLLKMFIFIIILRFVQGFLLAGLLSAALAYMAEEIDPKHFGFATTLYISCNSIGGMMGRFVTGYIAEQYTWQITMYILAIFGVVTFLLVLFNLPTSRYFTGVQSKVKEDLKGFVVHFKNPTLLLMFGLGMVLQIAFTGMWTYLPFHLLEAPYELSLKEISYFYFAYSLGVIGAPIAGLLTARFNISHLRVAGVFILCSGMMITLGSSLVLITIGLCIVCLGFFISHALATATVSQTATHHKGSASSLYLVAYYLGVSLGTTSLAPLWESYQWMGVILFTAILPAIYVFLVKGYQTMQTKK